MMRGLEGKVALVTGGAMGLGKAIATRLQADGATAVITDIQNDVGEAIAAELGFTFFSQDVTNEEQWPRIIGEIEKRFGRFDILVNNAGIVGPTDNADPETVRLADWRKVFAVNVESVFLGCRAAIPAMRRTGSGSIVNISSIAGLSASSYALTYGATKAAVAHMTKSIAQHCAEEGLNIRCNSVHPGNVHTPLWDKAAAERAEARGVTPQDILDEVGARNPMGGFTQPEDVAAAVAFLASDEACRMTGTETVVDGGSVNCNTFHLSAKFRDAILRSSTLPAAAS